MPVKARPFVSVVVPTADRCAVLVDCLEHLLRQTYPADRYEVIVVDDGSRDGTPEVVRSLAAGDSEPAVRYLRQSRRGAGAARNAGLELARAELICFLDDDALAPDRWLAALVNAADRHPGAGLLGGAVRPRFERPPPRTCTSHELAGARLDHGRHDVEVDEVWGCNMALRRSAVAATGGFDEQLAVAEDWDWGRRLRASRGRIAYVPEAWVWHRRLASDLGMVGLLIEHYRRGRVVGARDASRSPGGALGDATRALGHAACAGCTRGLTDAARSLGLWSGALSRRARRPEPPGRRA